MNTQEQVTRSNHHCEYIRLQPSQIPDPAVTHFDTFAALYSVNYWLGVALSTCYKCGASWIQYGPCRETSCPSCGEVGIPF